MADLTARGRQRRDALVAAAAALLLEGGPAAVTARAVAGRAQVPLGAVTYYFADVAGLGREASARVMAEHLTQARAAAEGVGPQVDDAGLARVLVAAVLGPYARGGVAGVRALYARTLAAAADERWAAEVRTWNRAWGGVVADLLGAAGRDPVHADAVLACVDGFAVALALEGAGPAVDVADVVAVRLAPVLPALTPRT